MGTVDIMRDPSIPAGVLILSLLFVFIVIEVRGAFR
jgi:hypothetical protein